MAKRKQPEKPKKETREASEPSGPGKQQTRLNAILEHLRKSGNVTVESLSEKFGTSLVTIRRDLDQLQNDGVLQRTHGGAALLEPLFYEPFKNDRTFQAHLESFSDEKRRIGQAAAALVEKGDTIALTPGTTTLEVIRGLPLNQNITVVTNTVNVAMELSKRKDLDIFVTGGHLRGDWFSLVGPTAVDSLKQMLIHTLFIGSDGIDGQWGVSCLSSEEAQLNAAMVKASRRRIAVVDSTKFGKVAGWRICDIGELNILITDTGATDGMIAPFVERGVDVRRV
ncbi:DeoR/GlpR family DNA-binding transcription regulator [Edaphobacter modestus]|uniref:DeoR family transcriptional regulator n=1 Tax=Edaphobacter modestus TaxID=388466 RepID=A0A4V2G4G2_9BACT|nr:DeoR/GlpR family DNA-binding transcription regulator [Edaphobacter modestus]RZU40796.1 DeoR family transcriptional regulator [Edaphobacter modestus]